MSLGKRSGKRSGKKTVICIALSVMMAVGMMMPAAALRAASTSAQDGIAYAADDAGDGTGSVDPGTEEPGTEEPVPEEPVKDTLAALYLWYQNYDNPSVPLAYSPTSQPTIVDAQGSMEMYAQSEFSNGNIDWTGDSGVGVVWSIVSAYDEAGAPLATPIATIDRADGIVHALGQGNGSIVVRCQAANYDVYEEATVYIKGNSGVPYVDNLEICDENGTVYQNDAEIRIDSQDFGLQKKFYVQVTYVDPVTGETTVKNTKNGDVIENLRWSVSGDSKTAYVNEETGVFIGKAAGTVRLTCTIAGGGRLGDTVDDHVMVLVGGDTLDPDRDYNPADELKVVVKYAAEDKGDIGDESDYEEARTWYYSPEELEQLGTTENLYTLVKSDGNWGTMKAYGVYLQSLIDDQDLSLDDIKGFYFGATDEYNPGFVGAGWLFSTSRYYFPNMSIGTGNLGAIQVAPMLATQTSQEDLVDEPSGDLSSQTRFRLCLGAESTTVNNAQQSVYNIHTITIILSGAPPVQWDTPGHGQGTSHGKGDGGDTPNDGGGEGDDNDPGKGDDDGPGGGATPGITDSNSGNTGGWNTPSTSTDPQTESTEEGSGTDTAGGSSGAAAGEAGDETAGTAEDAFGSTEQRWQVYEMMKKQESQVEALALDNPLTPYAVLLVLLVFAAGGGGAYLMYRRSLNPLANIGPVRPEGKSSMQGGTAHAAA